jgi:hypothetical protein
MISTEEITTEIARLHAFISGWFRGEFEQSKAVFDGGFSSVLSDEFVNVQPSGEVLLKSDLLASIEAAFAKNNDFFIEVSEIEIRKTIGEDFCLATYLEFQRGAKNTDPADNYRRSTVLFESVKGSLIWHHIHETAVDVANL